MKTKSILVLSIVAMLLAAFAIPASAAPLSEQVLTVNGALLSTATTTITSSSTTIGSGSTATNYSPQPGDIYLKRDKVTLDLAHSNLTLAEGYPVKVSLTLKGYLPDPCHQLRIVVGAKNLLNQINVSVYSVFDPTKACITLIQPFTATVSLGTFYNGTYAIYINGLAFRKFSISAPVLTN